MMFAASLLMFGPCLGGYESRFRICVLIVVLVKEVYMGNGRCLIERSLRSILNSEICDEAKG